ncbi:FadR family transcriptional regulator [Pasteurellaceae bacterium HPA106]|uniref:FadR/GntR family transcriptional regulator n=1 Tax=Spirabiliibacterium pneumoniae TaxID=221400 RepID=UPI001AAD4C77|nr:FCD domain-containing protein [Spirabiliibacterium pneumoniae]MBE2897003.1 FadR family transcriptional regulator [Spirabiliibacterium pneumoniae]
MLKSDFIIKKILDRIISGQYLMDELLPSEHDLCTDFGVSRTSVRSALQALANKNVITIQPKKASSINPIEEWDWLDSDILALFIRTPKSQFFVEKLLVTRLTFEPNICVQAAINRDDKDLYSIELGLKMMKRSLDTSNRDLFLQGDHLFHNNIIKASKNPFLTSLNNMLTTSMQITFDQTLEANIQQALPAIQRHEALFLAIKNKNCCEAKTTSKKLILNAIEKSIKDQNITNLANYL